MRHCLSHGSFCAQNTFCASQNVVPYRNHDGNVGGDDDEGGYSETERQDEKDVDSVIERGLHPPPVGIYGKDSYSCLDEN